MQFLVIARDSQEDGEWLRNVPYMKSGVWKDVQVLSFQVAAVGTADALTKAKMAQ